MLLATCEGDECAVSARCDARQSNLRLFLGKFVYASMYIMKQAMLERQCARTARRAMCELDAVECPLRPILPLRSIPIDSSHGAVAAGRGAVRGLGARLNSVLKSSNNKHTEDPTGVGPRAERAEPPRHVLAPRHVGLATGRRAVADAVP